MAGEDFYKGGRITPVNYRGYDMFATFRNADAELTSGNIISVDYCPDEVILKSPKTITKHHKRGEITTQHIEHSGYMPGSIITPTHNATSGMPWMHTFGVCDTSALVNTHTFTDSKSAYYYGYQFEMEHGSYAVRACALGSWRKHYRLEWGQDNATTHSYEDGVAKVIATSADIARPTTHDFRPPFPAGQFAHTFTYDSTSLGIVVLGGYFDRSITWKTHKVGDVYVTDAIKQSIDDEWGFTVRCFKSTIFETIPEESSDYSGTLSYYGKWYKDSTSDFMAISATNFWIDKDSIEIKKISDDAYLYEATFIAYPAGARTGISENVYTPTVIDDLSSTRYEGA